MKKFTFTLLLVWQINLTLQAQTNNFNYDRYWTKVQIKELGGLPKSADSIVTKIYKQAKADNNQIQLIKSLIYKSKFMIALEEEAQLKVVQLFLREITEIQSHNRHLLENMLADIYWQYYQRNRWKIYNRSRTTTKVDEDDFRTWDLTTIFNEIHALFQMSLKNHHKTQLIDLNDYNEILITADGSKRFRPTLFDFLAHNALDFYGTSESRINQPSYQFNITDPKCFTDFDTIELRSSDSLSPKLNTLIIYKKLGGIHRDFRYPEAWMYNRVSLLDFLHKNAVIPDKDELYVNALLGLTEKYRKEHATSLAHFKIADFYDKISTGYSIDSNNDRQFKRRKALEICNDVLGYLSNTSLQI
ncbi:MAG: alpha-2-macroglobulin, partial [Bacteroidota bacterium]